MMRFFCDGLTLQNRLVPSMRALSASSLSAVEFCTGEQSLDRNTKLGTDILGHALVVAGNDLMSTPPLSSAAIAAPALALGGSRNAA
jgi:hypothetical protein